MQIFLYVSKKKVSQDAINYFSLPLWLDLFQATVYYTLIWNASRVNFDSPLGLCPFS